LKIPFYPVLYLKPLGTLKLYFKYAFMMVAFVKFKVYCYLSYINFNRREPVVFYQSTFDWPKYDFIWKCT